FGAVRITSTAEAQTPTTRPVDRGRRGREATTPAPRFRLRSSPGSEADETYRFQTCNSVIQALARSQRGGWDGMAVQEKPYQGRPEDGPEDQDQVREVVDQIPGR